MLIYPFLLLYRRAAILLLLCAVMSCTFKYL
uniref:Uncharacterized protein n=1 Tax=Anguilla anguilla TaxID=7936 RepID=A0A0E9XAT2_ANGAN